MCLYSTQYVIRSQSERQVLFLLRLGSGSPYGVCHSDRLFPVGQTVLWHGVVEEFQQGLVRHPDVRLNRFHIPSPLVIDEGLTVPVDAHLGYASLVDPELGLFGEILDRIKKADAPLILVGTGVRLSHAENEVLALIKMLNVPVVVAWNAGDLIPFEHPLFAGMVGTVGTRAGNFALQSCDLLLSLGCRLNIRTVGYNRFDFAKNAYKIVVDIDENELKKPTVAADMSVHADVLALTKALLKEPFEESDRHIPWRQWCRRAVARYPSALPEYKKGPNEPINPYTFLDFLFSRLTEGDRIICSNGSACVMTFQAAKIKQGQRMFTNSGCAAMGYGLPASIGVAVADNSTRTLCIEGDGSMMMNLQELATVAKNKLNIKIILLNNNGYHSIRQTQKGLFQSRFVGLDEQSGLGFPDFKKVCAAFGLSYHKICVGCDLATLDMALEGERPCLIEVVVDPTQDFAPKCATKRGYDGTLSSPSLDDMKPFLPRDEYAAMHYKKP